MRVINLKVENVKRINAVDITPGDNPLVLVGGMNEAGKSSTLDSIQYAMAGAKELPEMPLKIGKARGQIVVDLGDIVVERKFTAKRSELVVRNKDGEPQDAPQTLLDKLYGKLTFDPEAFKRMNAAEKSQTLRSIVGLDFTELDKKREEVYRNRTDVNRRAKALKGTLDTTPFDPMANVPAEEVSAVDLMQQQTEAISVNTGNAQKREKYTRVKDSIGRISLEVGHLEDQIETLQKKLQDFMVTRSELIARQELMEEALPSLVDVDIKVINQKILDMEQINAKVRAKQDRDRVQNELIEHEDLSQLLTDEIQEIDDQKASKLASAKFPLEGLSFDETGMATFGGIPSDQWSSSQALKISTYIGIALNPRLRVLLIRNGSAFDDKNLEVIREIAVENDMQIWIERVGKDEKASVVIEDGYSKNPVEGK